MELVNKEFKQFSVSLSLSLSLSHTHTHTENVMLTVTLSVFRGQRKETGHSSTLSSSAT